MSGYTVKPPTGDTNEQTQFIDYFNLFYSKRGQEQISISQQLGNYGTTFFSASRQSYWNTSRSDQQISFGLNVPFGDITTSLNYSYSIIYGKTLAGASSIMAAQSHRIRLILP